MNAKTVKITPQIRLHEEIYESFNVNDLTWFAWDDGEAKTFHYEVGSKKFLRDFFPSAEVFKGPIISFTLKQSNHVWEWLTSNLLEEDFGTVEEDNKREVYKFDELDSVELLDKFADALDTALKESGVYKIMETPDFKEGFSRYYL